MQSVYVGVDVGGTKLAYGLYDEEFKLLARRREPSMPEAPAEVMIDSMVGHVDALLKDADCPKERLAGLGAIFPSYIDKRLNTIVMTTNLPNWVDLPIKDILQAKLGVRVEIDNDGNGAALAEHRHGAGRGKEHMIYITVSTGIGGGIIINKRIFYGSFGMAGEAGHMFVSDTYGSPCGCGNVGCAESIASGPSVEKYIARHIDDNRVKTCLKEISGGGPVTTIHLAEGVRRGDAFSLEVIEHVGEYLARMYASLYHMLNIDHVVYGGGLMKIKEIMVIAERRFNEMVKFAKRYPVTFVPAQLGDDVGILGAALLVAE